MQDDKRAALNLLKTAKGQLDGIIKMIDSDRYCVDISKQILAVNSLIKKANLSVLKGHINTCVKNAFLEDGSDEKVDEIINLLDKYML